MRDGDYHNCMRRFVLLHKGRGNPPKEDCERIQALPGVRIIDDELPRLLLVEAKEEELRDLITQMPSWVMTAETSVTLKQK